MMKLRPETNEFREAISLDGLWRCGISGSDARHTIAVPGSWNEQLAERGFMNRTDTVLYERDVLIPARATERVVLHFGSADYSAVIFWNDREVGRSGPPKLPFTVDLSGVATPGETGRLRVDVTTELPEHGPMQRVVRQDYFDENRARSEYFPPVRFDFFPFGGLNRSVTLNLLPDIAMPAPRIRSDWQEGQAVLSVDAPDDAVLTLSGPDFPAREIEPGIIDKVRPWSPEDPALYTLSIVTATDRVTRRIGFRRFEIDGMTARLNGEPIQLKGFGKHEDTPVAGRGVNLPYLVKDFGLLSWIGANSVRTSHYPYDETFLDMADEQGILVISEVFSVNLDFRRTDERDLAAHKDSVSDLIARDGHHACVVAWSLSNEPGYLDEPEYKTDSGPYWEALFAHARTLDDRPMTVANVQYAGDNDPVFPYCDFITLNRYFGWYSEPGQLDRARDALETVIGKLSDQHGKPVFFGEFGADAVAGMHATTDQMWTEDYQSDFLETYWSVIDAHPGCIGGHVWNFADFRTAQHGRRAVMNRKGVFTRERDPKRAAFTLRRLWGASDT